MSTHRSPTARAMSRKREAYVERRLQPGAPLAPMFEREANALLTLPSPPDVGAGGEVVEVQTAGLPGPRFAIQETLREGASRIAEDASIRRTDLLMQPSLDAVAMGVDAAESIGAENSLEKMLAHQLALAHEGAMRLMGRALGSDSTGREVESVEACRLANTAARMMTTYQDGLLTLQRLRTGGTQTVTVSHVNVQSGAQAVIGNVQTGGAKREEGVNNE